MRSFLCVALLGLWSCALFSSASGLRVRGVERERLTRALAERDYVLASSVYVGNFFGDAGRLLVDPRPSEILDFQHHSGAAATLTPFAGDVLYAGTPVKLTQIVYPPDDLEAALDERSALEPTAHTWLMLERTDQPSKPLVIVLPKDIATADEFQAHVRERLASHQWVSTWLIGRQAKVLDAIYRKQVEPGMSTAEMLAALGQPRNAAELRNPELLEVVADYGTTQATVAGGLVVSVRDLKAEAESARKEAEARAEEARLAAAAAAEKQAQEAAALKAQDEQKSAEQQKLAQADEKRRALETQLADAKAREQAAAAERQRQADLQRLAAEAAKAEAGAKRREELAQRARERDERELARVRGERDATEQRYAKSLAQATAEVEAADQGLRQAVASAEAKVSDARAALAEAGKPQPPKAGSLPVGRKLGISSAAVSGQLARELQLAFPTGAYVAKVSPDSAGAQAGVEAGDVVLTFDGADVRSPEDLGVLTAKAPNDRKVYMEVWRSGGRQVLALAGPEPQVDKAAVARADATLRSNERAMQQTQKEQGAKVEKAQIKLTQVQQQRAQKLAPIEKKIAALEARLGEVAVVSAATPAAAPLAPVAAPMPANATPSAEKRSLGLKLKPLGSDDAAKLGIEGGAQVLAVTEGGLGASAGLHVNDVVVAFGGRAVTDIKALAQWIQEAPADRTVYLEVVRDGKRQVLAMAIVAPTRALTKSSAADVAPQAVQDPDAEPLEPAPRQDNRHLIPGRSPDSGAEEEPGEPKAGRKS